MTERLRAGEIEIAYETFGAPGDPPLLLIMGLGMQMLAWRDDLCGLLADQGFRAIRFDNRDVGLSTHLDDAPEPDLPELIAGDHSSAPYQIEDMAEDALGLLNGLGIERAHVVGASMGGYIAQALAIRRPDRVLSLTSIMSTPSVEVGRATRDAQVVLLAPPATSRDAAAQRAVEVMRVIGSPDYPFDEQEVVDLARQTYDRHADPRGVLRQLAAIVVSSDRTDALRGLRVPTLVIHGEADPLVQLEGGKATAAAIPGARLLTFPGMGHDLPRALWPPIVAAIADLARDAGASVAPANRGQAPPGSTGSPAAAPGAGTRRRPAR
jgi:pimeloyl-ACP methyl ester carboxylesterase